MATLTMKPGSSATFTLTVQTAAGAPVTGAVISAVFRRPDSAPIAEAIPFADIGGGKFTADILPAWTTRNNKPYPGRYLVDITVTKDSDTITERFDVLADF